MSAMERGTFSYYTVERVHIFIEHSGKDYFF